MHHARALGKSVHLRTQDVGSGTHGVGAHLQRVGGDTRGVLQRACGVSHGKLDVALEWKSGVDPNESRVAPGVVRVDRAEGRAVSPGVACVSERGSWRSKESRVRQDMQSRGVTMPRGGGPMLSRWSRRRNLVPGERNAVATGCRRVATIEE
jgi:hypothetical protein